MTPSLRHQLLATLVPRLRGAGDLDVSSGVAAAATVERDRVSRRQEGLDRSLPTGLVPGLGRQWVARRELLAGTDGEFPSWALEPRTGEATSTVYHLHGGGFVSPADSAHVRWATRVAGPLGARVVLPDYPLAPAHDWRSSRAALVEDVARYAELGRVVLTGDSAGGGIALAVAQELRDRGGPAPSRMVLVSPWVDLSESTPQTATLDGTDPWLHLSKLRLYASWWAGSDDPAELARPELSPALGDLDGLPPTLVLCGTRDLLHPGCRLLADRAAAARWAMTYVERPDLIHVYPLLPGVPEARTAGVAVAEFVR